MTLRELAVGETCVINSVGGEGALRQHFLDMGVIPGVEVTLVKLAPMGDPMELRIHGYELTLRLADAEQIEVVTVTKDSEDTSDNKDNDEIKKNSGKSGKSSDKEEDKDKKKHKHHPGLGEGGIYHDHTKEKKLPHGTLLTFALAGNQNSGKTTLFNQLTGSNQHVGNFPGVTVDRKSGVIKGHNNTEVVDLPGIYSLSPYTDLTGLSKPEGKFVSMDLKFHRVTEWGEFHKRHFSARYKTHIKKMLTKSSLSANICYYCVMTFFQFVEIHLILFLYLSNTIRPPIVG